jgi:hypothetical protein
MNGKPNGRLCVRRSENEPYVRWRGSDSTLAEIARDPYVNVEINSLSDALAEVAGLHIRAGDGALVWLSAGELVPVNLSTLPQIVTRHAATERLVNNGKGWVVEYVPLVVDERTLRYLLMPDRRAGGLRERVLKA